MVGGNPVPCTRGEEVGGKLSKAQDMNLATRLEDPQSYAGGGTKITGT